MTNCDTCLNYLQRRRTTLLPHLGRFVVTTGKKPATLVRNLTDLYHGLGHPTRKHIVLKTDPSEATKALRRLASKKRP